MLQLYSFFATKEKWGGGVVGQAFGGLTRYMKLDKALCGVPSCC